jgi:hypothetical protein
VDVKKDGGLWFLLGCEELEEIPIRRRRFYFQGVFLFKK